MTKAAQRRERCGGTSVGCRHYTGEPQRESRLHRAEFNFCHHQPRLNLNCVKSPSKYIQSITVSPRWHSAWPKHGRKQPSASSAGLYNVCFTSSSCRFGRRKQFFSRHAILRKAPQRPTRNLAKKTCARSVSHRSRRQHITIGIVISRRHCLCRQYRSRF
jgi:hypothetical protein